MNAEPNATPLDQNTSGADVVRSLIRFLRALRFRSLYVITALVATILLGALYFATAPRIYQATASLMVLQSGSNAWDTSLGRDNVHQDLIPTFEKLFTKSVVLEGAVERLKQEPAEMRVDFGALPASNWRKILERNLSSKGVRNTNLIELDFRSRNPRAAETVLRAIMDSYLEFLEKTHKDVSVEIVQILDRERRDVVANLEAKQARVRELSHEIRSLGLDERSAFVQPIVKRVLTLNDKLIAVRDERIQLDASLGAVQVAMRDGGDVRQHLTVLEPLVGRDLVLGALGLDPETRALVTTMERELIADRARLQTLRQHYGNRHPDIDQLTISIQTSEQFLLAQQTQQEHRPSATDNIRLGQALSEMIQQRLAKTRQYELELTREYALAEAEAVKLEDQTVELQMVDREVTLLRSLHETLVGRIADLDIKQNRADVRWAVVSDPIATDSPVSPRLALVVACCLFFGLGAGVLAVYLMDLLDDRFRSPEEISQQLGVPVLAMVRKLPVVDATGVAALHVHTAPNSVESEAFRTLRTALAFSGRDTQRIAVTSSEPSDGKTTVLANLAVSLAQAGKRVLVIDADLRKPGLSRLFDLRREAGLSDVLLGTEDVARSCRSLVHPTELPELHVLGSGPKPVDPVELLSRDRFAQLIAWAETAYDQVLIDCPPIVAASDAAVVGRLVDCMVLVVQPHKNPRRMVIRSTESLMAMKIEFAGVVVNQLGAENDKGYYGYGFNYGYGYGYGYGDGAAYGSESDNEAEETQEQDARNLQRAA